MVNFRTFIEPSDPEDTYDPDTASKIDGDALRAVAQRVAADCEEASRACGHNIFERKPGPR